jgi:uncharacterized SAM-binding protein YcdF (DUF218 family)
MVAYTTFMDKNVESAVNTLWDYMQLHDAAGPAECLVVLGSRDDRVAIYAAELIKRFSYNSVVVSGGSAHHNDLLRTQWKEPTEAEHFSHIIERYGVDMPIYLETKATNTGENAVYSYDLLKKHGITPSTLLVVTKPYMERRAKATFDVQWPVRLHHMGVTSPPTSFHEYVNEQQPVSTVVNIMVGDLHRIIEYPSLGLQSKQAVPSEVMSAFELLVDAGYTKHLVQPM